MPRRNVFGLLLIVSLFLGVAAIGDAAGKKVVKPFTTHRDATICGQPLPKGTYNIEFTEDQEGEVLLLQGKRQVLKAVCKLMSMTKPAAATQVLMERAANGSYRVSRIELEGVSVALVFE